MICVPCATGNCRDCRRNVSRGRVTKACACRHGARPQMVRPADPRRAGGGIVAAGPGEGETLLDTRRAVIVDAAEVCRVDNPSDGRALMALFLEGRINATDDRAAFLSLLNADGAAALVTQLVGLAARMGPQFEAEFRERLDERIDVADLWPSTAPT
jgi:hypothetical protein